MRYYPVFLNLKGKRVLLLGGGAVALRKVRTLIESGARVVAVSREFSNKFLRFAKQRRVQICRGSAVPKLRDFSLVVAATSDTKLNQEVYARSERAHLFVNVVDDPKRSSFIVPSTLKRGSLQIAVSTGGKSPLLAKWIRRKLEHQFGGEWRDLIQWLGEERKKVKRLITEQKLRRQYLQQLVEMRLHELEKGKTKRK